MSEVKLVQSENESSATPQVLQAEADRCYPKPEKKNLARKSVRGQTNRRWWN